MPRPRFLQIHTLSPYTAALLNRDDTGLAKRLPYGGTLRTRVSSQCLKRHWRLTDDSHALQKIDGVQSSYRSRELVTQKVINPLRDRYSDDVINVLEPEFQKAVYGDKGTTKTSRQTLLFGAPEIRYLANEAARLAEEANGDKKSALELVQKWKKDFLKNIQTMRNNIQMPAGIAAALFGRMVTSDTNANIVAPIHVAHSFTVHAEESESDYFTAMDDLAGDEPGADTIQETELTSGLFYGYVVVDIPGLVNNLGGDAVLSGQILHNLVYLIAEVSPGAKLGSTAPYGRASLMLLESGDRQPRSLAEAYRTACKPKIDTAIEKLKEHLTMLDDAYATGEERRVLSLVDIEIPRAERGSIAELADWTKDLPNLVMMS